MGTVLHATSDNFQSDIFNGWGIQAVTSQGASGGLMSKVKNGEPVAIGNLYAIVAHNVHPDSPLENFTLIKPLKLTRLMDIINQQK